MNKCVLLRKILKRLDRVIVAYSGGVDSAFLLKAAIDALGEANVLAVTARSSSYPEREYRDAVGNAKILGARHLTINSGELKINRFSDNPVNRCYYCKKELFNKLLRIAKKGGYKYVCDGANYDDRLDMRFGSEAAKELGIRSPLMEAHMTKADIRRWSKRLGLPTWNKPSFACLASRIPYGKPITRGALKKIDSAESLIHSLGIRQVRVRLHDDTARIEVMPREIAKLLNKADAGKIVRHLHCLGFRYITIDMEGYRTGSMNP